jgi:hypothetical protein
MEVNQDLEADFARPMDGSDEVGEGASDVGLKVEERDDGPVPDRYADVGEAGSFDLGEIVKGIE